MTARGFHKRYQPIYDAVASADIDQEDREQIAVLIASNLREARAEDFGSDQSSLFVLLASDPLVPCAGHHGEPCPHGRVIRLAMHNRDEPDGRSAAWRERAPYGEIRCVSCGAREFIPQYDAAVSERGE
jgi:hypothetical protein